MKTRKKCKLICSFYKKPPTIHWKSFQKLRIISNNHSLQKQHKIVILTSSKYEIQNPTEKKENRVKVGYIIIINKNDE